MKYEINKERIWVFAPVAAISTIVEVEGKTTFDDMKIAIRKAVCKNDVLKTRVEFEGSKAYLIGQNEACYRVEETTEEMTNIIHREEKIPFDLSKGEYLRFFLIVEDTKKTVHNEWKLLIMSHHLAGDGTSLAYLIQDIMKALNQEELSGKPV